MNVRKMVVVKTLKLKQIIENVEESDTGEDE
jgi:hypothetical protein